MPFLRNRIRSTSVSQILSDDTWLTLADFPPNNFSEVDFDDSSWSSAFIISPYPLWDNSVMPESDDPSAYLLFKGDWIWTTEMNNTARQIPPATRPFRKKVISPTGQTAVSANISIAVDDTFTLFVNGNDIGHAPSTNPDWRVGYFFPGIPLDPSVNVFAISATNVYYPGSGTGESSGNVVVGISIVYADPEANSTVVPVASGGSGNTHYSHLSKGALAGVITGTVILFLIFLCGFVLCIRRSGLRLKQNINKPEEVHETRTPYPLDISPQAHSQPSSKHLSAIRTLSSITLPTGDVPTLGSPHTAPSSSLAMIPEADLATVVSRLVQEQLGSQAPPQYEPADAVLES
jgi:hypothetical protein